MQRTLAAPLAVLACLVAAAPAAAASTDRNHDKIPDSWERQYQISTRVNSAAGDPDKDGLKNLAEYTAKTNPRKADTDGDGISDGREVANKTDPRNAKSPKKASTPAPTPAPDPDPDPAPEPDPTPTPDPTPDPTPVPDPTPTPTTTTTPAPPTTTTPTTTTPAPPTTTTPTTTTPSTTTPPPTTTTPPPTTTPPTTPPTTTPTPAPDLAYPSCTKTVSTASTTTSAVSAAAPGAVICLADGTYGSMSFNYNKTAQVTIRAEHPGSVTLGNITTTGSYLKFMGFKFVNGDIQLQPPAHEIVIQRNNFTGGGFAVDMASADANISDVTIRANRMVGPFGEDAIRANRYHDADGDGVGLLVEGNEFTNVVQQGGSSAPHADLLQSVWGGDHIVFRKNYAHDNRAENFFIKDQPGTVNGVLVENNLMIRNGVAAAGAGQPSIVNLYGPTSGMKVRNNTIWDTQGSSPIAWQGSGWGDIDWDHNLLYRAWGSGSGGTWSLNNNTYCEWLGTLPSAGGLTQACNPTFVNPATDDYRVAGSDRGIDWRPADQTYGF